MKIPKPKFEPGQECVLERNSNICYISHVRLYGEEEGKFNWQYELMENRQGKLERIHGSKVESEIKTYVDWKAGEIKRHLDAALDLGWCPTSNQANYNDIVEECAAAVERAGPGYNYDEVAAMLRGRKK